mgnify:CR=1 FL=1
MVETFKSLADEKLKSFNYEYDQYFVDEFVKKLTEKAKLRVSEPIIDKIQFDKVSNFIQDGVDEGANLEIGGPVNGSFSGFFVLTTIFTNVTDEMSIAKVWLVINNAC